MKKILFLLCLFPQILIFSQQLKPTGFKEEWHLCLTTGYDNGDMAIFFTNPGLTKYAALMIDANGVVKERIPLKKSFKLEGLTPSRYAIIHSKKGYALIPSKVGNYFLLTDEKLIQKSIQITDPSLRSGEILNVRMRDNGNPQWLVSNVQVGQTPELYSVEYDKSQDKIISTKLAGGSLEKVIYGGKFVCKGNDFSSLHYIQWPKKADSFTISTVEIEEKQITNSSGSHFSFPEGQIMKAIEEVEEFGDFDSKVVASMTLSDSKGNISEIMFITIDEDYQISKFPINKIIDTKSLQKMNFGVYNCSYGSYLFSKRLGLSMNGVYSTSFFTTSVAELEEGAKWQVLNLTVSSFSELYNAELTFDHSQIFLLDIFKQTFDLATLNNPDNRIVEITALSFGEDTIQTFICLKNKKYIPEFDIIEYVASPLAE